MSRKYKFSDPDGLYFISFATIGWIDVFTRRDYRDIVVDSLRHCPVFTPAQGVWFRCKALEVATHVFFRPPGGEMFCTRAQRAARDRVARAQDILRQRLAEPRGEIEIFRLRRVGGAAVNANRAKRSAERAGISHGHK